MHSSSCLYISTHMSPCCVSCIQNSGFLSANTSINNSQYRFIGQILMTQICIEPARFMVEQTGAKFIVIIFSFILQNRELQIMRKLEHVNIVKLLYFFYSSGDKVSERFYGEQYFGKWEKVENPMIVCNIHIHCLLDPRGLSCS